MTNADEGKHGRASYIQIKSLNKILGIIHLAISIKTLLGIAGCEMMGGVSSQVQRI